MPIDKLDLNYQCVMTVQHNLNVLHLLSFVQQVFEKNILNTLEISRNS